MFLQKSGLTILRLCVYVQLSIYHIKRIWACLILPRLKISLVKTWDDAVTFTKEVKPNL